MLVPRAGALWMARGCARRSDRCGACCARQSVAGNRARQMSGKPRVRRLRAARPSANPEPRDADGVLHTNDIGGGCRRQGGWGATADPCRRVPSAGPQVVHQGLALATCGDCSACARAPEVVPEPLSVENGHHGRGRGNVPPHDLEATSARGARRVRRETASAMALAPGWGESCTGRGAFREGSLLAETQTREGARKRGVREGTFSVVLMKEPGDSWESPGPASVGFVVRRFPPRTATTRSGWSAGAETRVTPIHHSTRRVPALRQASRAFPVQRIARATRFSALGLPCVCAGQVDGSHSVGAAGLQGPAVVGGPRFNRNVPQPVGRCKPCLLAVLCFYTAGS